MTPTQFMNVVAMAAGLYAAAVIGWAAVGTNTDRPTRTVLDVLEPKNDHDGR